MPVAAKDQHKMAFVSPFGLFWFRVMPFGLSGAPASFQRLMDHVVDGFVAAYLNTLVIFGMTWEDHLEHLRAVMQRLKESGLTVKPKMCQFGMRQCLYLGHVVGGRTRCH